MRIAVVHNAISPGAPADERDVLVQRDAVMAALSGRGHECSSRECTLDLEAARRRLLEHRPDVVFNLVESLAGSDRLAHLFPALLETLGIPYTGNTAAALWLSNNKPAAKERLLQAGLPTPAWLSSSSHSPHQVRCYGGEGRGEGRFIIKTIWEHASFGLHDDAIVEAANAQQLARLIEERSARLVKECFAEQFIEGREFNISLLTDPHGLPTLDRARMQDAGCRMQDRASGSSVSPAHSLVAAVQVLPPAEIDFSAFPADKPRIVGYEAKWDDRSMEFHHTPRRFDFPAADAQLLERLVALARRCWEVFDLRGYVRVDFRVDSTGQPWILEINTNPCLSPDAGYAAALERAGISYADAMERIVEEAVRSQESGVRSQGSGVRSQESEAGKQGSHVETRRGDAGTRGRGEVPASPRRRVPTDSFLLTPDSWQFRRHVVPSDAEAVRRIVESTGFFYPHECDVAVELVEERLAKGEASGYYFVFAEKGGEQASKLSHGQGAHAAGPIAYACYGPVACTTGSYDLFWIAVHRDHQRSGLGRRLLDESERLIKAAGGRRVYIETSNRPQYGSTRAFYERCGYACEAVLKEFYGPGDDKVIFVKAL